MQNIIKNPSSFPAVRHSALVCLMFNVKITYLKKKHSHTEQKVYNSPYAKVYIDANRTKTE